SFTAAAVELPKIPAAEIPNDDCASFTASPRSPFSKLPFELLADFSSLFEESFVVACSFVPDIFSDVFGPTIPSTERSLSFWKYFTALSVFLPIIPSFATFTLSWSVLISAPLSPYDKLFGATLTDDLLLVSFVFVSSVCFSSVSCSVLFAFFPSAVRPP